MKTLQSYVRIHLFDAWNFTCREILVRLLPIQSRACGPSRSLVATTFKVCAATEEIHLKFADDMIRAVDHYRGGSLDYADQMIVATHLSPQVHI